MNADEIATIRNLRGFNVPWKVIAKDLTRSVAECRQAIGLPVYDKPAERGGALGCTASQAARLFKS